MRLLNYWFVVFLLTCTTAQADSLREVYLLAKENDRQLSIVKIQADIAQESITQARSALLPTVRAGAGYDQTYGRTESFDLDMFGFPSSDTVWKKRRSSGVNAVVAMNLSIYNRANWIGLDIREKQAARSMVVYYAAEQSLVTSVIEAYLAVLWQKTLYDLNDQELDQLKQIMAQTRLGSTPYLELLARINQLSAQRTQVYSQWLNSLSALSVITGQPHHALDALDNSQLVNTKLSGDISSFIDLANSGNYSLVAGKMELDIARDQLKIAHSARLPTISGGLIFGYGEDMQTNLTTRNVAGSISVDLPVYSGGAISSNMKMTQYQYVLVSQSIDLLNRNIVNNVTNIYNAVNSSSDMIDIYREAVGIAEKTLEATKLSAKQGSRNTADVINAIAQYYFAQSGLVNAQFDYVSSSIALKKEIGQLSEQDVLDIDAYLERTH